MRNEGQKDIETLDLFETKSQKQMILEFMQQGRMINKYLAFQLFGCMTLAQRIDDIEDDIEKGKLTGWQLCRNRVKEHNNASAYWMKPINNNG